jgi:hypothetical protein
MNSRHRKTLHAVFSEPVLRNIEWRRIEALFLAVGCEMIEGSGARVAFKRGELRADFHRPHPAKEAKPYQVRAAREFLEKLEIQR